MAEIAIDVGRVMDQLEHLAGFSDAPAPAVTRVLYTDTDLAARQYLKSLIAEVGLQVREDALGNLYARWAGGDPSLAPVATGSHIDAIPNAGRYDGTVGVLGGLEAIRALKAAGITPRRSLELIVFTSEEPTRFGVGCLGSRAMSGILGPDDIRALKDDSGKNPDEVRVDAGFEGELEQLRLEPDAYHAFIELHIEQGPLLERKGIPIGVVTAIAAPATLHITLEGEGGHAGAVLMPERKDALVAGAEIAQAVEEAALRSGAPDTVATVGIFDVYPRAVNSIPSKVFMSVDVRDTDLTRRDHAVETIKKATERITHKRKIKVTLKVLNADPPARCDEQVTRAVEQAASELQCTTLPMVSRAYHDALFMAQVCPTGMIFIPCKNGVSHRPDEYTSPEDIRQGANVLARALSTLAR